jgi:hypothetical protein
MISFFTFLSFRSAVGVASSHSNTALLLCSNNFFLNLCQAVRFWLTPRVSFFLLGFQRRYLVRSQLLSFQKFCDPAVTGSMHSLA